MATIVAAAGGGNWTAGGTWVGGNAPTSADDAQLTSTSGNVTIDSGAACRSLDCTGYTGTLTHTATVTLHIGDATTGAGNIALKMVAGMTYSMTNAPASAIAFQSTSSTVQTITTGGQTLGTWSVNGAGSSYQLADSNTVGTLTTVNLTSGTLNTNGQACSWGAFFSNNSNTRTLSLGSSTVTITGTSGLIWDTSTTTNLTFNSGTSTLLLNSRASAAPLGMTFSPGGLSFNNVTVTGNAAGDNNIAIAGNFTVTGLLTISGNAPQFTYEFLSSIFGTARTITCSNPPSLSNVVFIDIASAGAGGTWTGTYLGDCGGNSGITFDNPRTLYWVGNGGNMTQSSHFATSSGGASGANPPLPQDSVKIDVNSITSTGQTIQNGHVLVAKDVDFTGVTNTPTFQLGTTCWIFGSLTLVSGMSFNATQSMNFAGRQTHTITSAGKSFGSTIVIEGPGGSYTLQDDLSTTSTNAASFRINYGTFDANGHNVTCGGFASINGGGLQASPVRTINMGSGTWTLTATGTQAVWNISPTTNLTFNAGTSTIAITANDSGVTKTFVGAGLTYGALQFKSSGTANLAITGGNTFSSWDFECTSARTVSLPASGTQIVTGAVTLQGASGQNLSLVSNVPGTTSLLTLSGVATASFTTFQDINANQAASIYAINNCTNTSNNHNVIFTKPSGSATAGAG